MSIETPSYDNSYELRSITRSLLPSNGRIADAVSRGNTLFSWFQTAWQDHADVEWVHRYVKEADEQTKIEAKVGYVLEALHAGHPLPRDHLEWRGLLSLLSFAKDPGHIQQSIESIERWTKQGFFQPLIINPDLSVTDRVNNTLTMSAFVALGCLGNLEAFQRFHQQMGNLAEMKEEYMGKTTPSIYKFLLLDEKSLDCFVYMHQWKKEQREVALPKEKVSDWLHICLLYQNAPAARQIFKIAADEIDKTAPIPMNWIMNHIERCRESGEDAVEVLKILAEELPFPNTKSEGQKYYRSAPLLKVVQPHVNVVNQLALVDFLVAQGDDVNEIDNQDRTVLYRAILENNLPLIKKLVEHGADIRHHHLGIAYNRYVCMRGTGEMVDYVLSQSNEEERSILYQDAGNNQDPEVMIIVERFKLDQETAQPVNNAVYKRARL